MQTEGGQGTYPTNIGQVTDVITLNTPHTGVFFGADVAVCGGCQQVADMVDTGMVMTFLKNQGRNPQVSSEVETSWTVIGSDSDLVIQYAEATGTGAANAVDMNARHAIMYTASPYGHMETLNDMDTASQDMHEYYCYTPLPDTEICGTDYKNGNWLYRENGLHSLQEVYNKLTSDEA